MDCKRFTAPLTHLDELLQQHFARIIASTSKSAPANPEMQDPCCQYPEPSAARLSGTAARFHEAIGKFLGGWQQPVGVDEHIGWSQQEVCESLYHAVNFGLSMLNSHISGELSAAGNICHIKDGRPALSLADCHIEKITTTAAAAMRIRQHGDQAQSMMRLCLELLELKAQLVDCGFNV